MNRPRFGLPIIGIILSALQACTTWSPVERVGSREPVRWILVERRYGDVASPAASDDGQVNPDATVLAFQPLYQEDLTWEVVVSPEDHFVELIEFSPAGPASPGEIISATVRVGNAKPGQRYRLEAKPSQSGVKILGSQQVLLTGGASTVFRFTSCVSGRGGIAVGVERLDVQESGARIR